MGYDLVKVGEVVEGRYKIIKPIADGGMGTVFLAEHWLIKRKVAIKILHAELAQDATMIRRFMNEALAAGTLGHPNIVESTDMGFTKGDVPYIVFEYLEGTPVAERDWRNVSPSLVVEVLSEGTEDKDLERNRRLYLQVPSIREYWIVDPQATANDPMMIVFRRRGRRWAPRRIVSTGETYTTPMLPGFSVVLVDPLA